MGYSAPEPAPRRSELAALPPCRLERGEPEAEAQPGEGRGRGPMSLGGWQRTLPGGLANRIPPTPFARLGRSARPA